MAAVRVAVGLALCLAVARAEDASAAPPDPSEVSVVEVDAMGDGPERKRRRREAVEERVWSDFHNCWTVNGEPVEEGDAQPGAVPGTAALPPEEVPSKGVAEQLRQAGWTGSCGLARAST